jgi:hypothetical protein
MSTTKVSFYADRQAAVAAIADAQPKPRKGLESLAIRPDQVIEAAVEIGLRVLACDPGLLGQVHETTTAIRVGDAAKIADAEATLVERIAAAVEAP